VELLLALTIGTMAAASVYLMLARNVLRFIFGLILLSNAANMTIFLSGRLTPGVPPLIEYGADQAAPGVSNALPQALVLTAIVIGFGLFAFALMLVFRAYQAMGTLDGDRMRLAEPMAEEDPLPEGPVAGPGPVEAEPAGPGPIGRSRR
jgi:multicomponent Na+:H+ antiporter subunit C